MARNISKESLEQKIAKIEKAISKNREQSDRLTAELEELHKKQRVQVNNQERKTKPELWKQIEELEQKLRFIENFLETKGLLLEAEDYVEKAIQDTDELPFD